MARGDRSTRRAARVVTGLAAARQLFGAEAVARALAESVSDVVTEDLAREVRRRADPPGAFRAWALGLPWPHFCAVVRIVSGEAMREIEVRK